VADEMNKILPNGIDTEFKDVSIVEIGFMGNVVREFYRISLIDGKAWDVHQRTPGRIRQVVRSGFFCLVAWSARRTGERLCCAALSLPARETGAFIDYVSGMYPAVWPHQLSQGTAVPCSISRAVSNH
jgi:hypothetical protein